MRSSMALAAAMVLGLTGCATALQQPHRPAVANQTVSLVNSLSWTDAVTDKADAARTAWPLSALQASHKEQFPLAQVRQCDAARSCSWGVIKAQRILSAPRPVAGAVAVELELEVARRHETLQGGERMGLAIPADVPALSAQRALRQSLVLPYGTVQRIVLDHGIAYAICAQRRDAAGKAMDACDIPYM